MNLRMKSTRSWVLGALALGLASCTTPVPPETTATGEAASEATASSANLPIIVAANSVVCDLTQQIAQDTIALTCLLEPGQDPHTYAPTPSDRRAIDSADLILYDGYNLTPGIAQLVDATQNPAPKIAVLEEAVPTPLMGAGHDHDHDHGHDHGEEAAGADDHDHDHSEEAAAGDHDHDHSEEAAAVAGAELEPDPHVWHNAEHGVAMVRVIEAQLVAIAPDHTDLYQTNAGAIAQQLTELHEWIGDQVSTVPMAQRKLVTPHDAFRYFAEAYDFTVAGALSGLSTEAAISAGTLVELVNEVKEAEVLAIFAETTTNPKSIEAVAREANVAVAPQALFVEGPMGEGTPAPTYQAMLAVNTCTIVEALGGSCALDQAPGQP